MATLSNKEIANIAKLARLNPSPEILASFSDQCDSILDYFNQLSTIDTTSVEELYNPLSLIEDFQQNLRADEVYKNISKTEILSNSPAHDADYFVVPRIVEGK